MNKEKTGLLIKSARLQKGYTQSELGDILGVSNKAISRWEKGDSFPDVGILEDLSNCLDISIEELVSGEPDIDKDKSLTALLRLVIIQAKDSIIRKQELIANIGIMLILIMRFYFSFLSRRGYNWDFKLDMALLIICFVGVALRIVKGRIICSYLRYKQFFILNIIILLMSIVSIVVMYTGFIYWEHIVTFVKPENLGPTLSRVFGIIALFNIGLFEYEWVKIKNTRTVSLIMAFVSLANVFLCISYRELMGSVLTIDYAVQSIGVITISIIISTIAAITAMKHCK